MIAQIFPFSSAKGDLLIFIQVDFCEFLRFNFTIFSMVVLFLTIFLSSLLKSSQQLNISEIFTPAKELRFFPKMSSCPLFEINILPFRSLRYTATGRVYCLLLFSSLSIDERFCVQGWLFQLF